MKTLAIGLSLVGVIALGGCSKEEAPAAPAAPHNTGANTAAPTGGSTDSGNQDFELINGTGQPIEELHISLSKDDKWGGDILGVDVLPDQQKGNIKFTGYKPTDCAFDLKVKVAGTESVIPNIDLCKTNTVKFVLQDGKIFYAHE